MIGNAVAKRALSGTDGLFYAPFDWAGPGRRMLERVKPALLVIMETEIWPNLIHARERAHLGALPSPLTVGEGSAHTDLGDVDLFLMQSEAHAARILQMGAPGTRVRTSGNLKFDALPRTGASAPLNGLKKAYSDGTVAVDMDPARRDCAGWPTSAPLAALHRRHAGAPAAASPWRPRIAPKPSAQQPAARPPSPTEPGRPADIVSGRNSWRAPSP